MNKSTQPSTMNPENLPDLFYKDQPVVTTECLAVLYSADSKHIIQNFNNNQKRFSEETHFFKLKNEELRTFKNYVENFDIVNISPHTKHLFLWTERGAARHAKMLNTDQAWNVFEKLEDAYFNRIPYGVIKGAGPASKEQKLGRIVSVFSSAKRLSREAGLSGDEAILKANEITQKTIGINVFESFNIPKPKSRLDADDCPEDVKVFLEMMDRLLESGKVLDHSDKLDKIWIHMPTTLAAIEQEIGRNFNRGVLFHQIKKSDRYVEQKRTFNSKVLKKPIAAWAISKHVSCLL